MKYDLVPAKNKSHRFKLSFLKSLFFHHYFLTTVSLITTIGIIFYSLVQLKLRYIVCQIENETCNAETVKSLQTLLGQTIFFTDYETLINNQVSSQPFRLVEFNLVLPSSLYINLQSLEPIYNLKLVDQKIAVDKNGNLIEQDIPHLPSLLVQPDCSIINSDQKINLNFHQQLIHTWQLLKEKNINPELIECRTADLIIFKISPSLPQFLLNSTDLTSQIQKMLILLNSLQLDTFNPSIQEVDLRFKQPVLRESSTQ